MIGRMRVRPPYTGLNSLPERKPPFLAQFSKRYRRRTLRRDLLARGSWLEAIHCLDPSLKRELVPKYRRAVFRLWQINAATWWGLAGMAVVAVLGIFLWVSAADWLFRDFVFSYSAAAQCAAGFAIPFASYLLTANRFLRPTIATIFISLFVAVTLLALPQHMVGSTLRNISAGVAGAQLLGVLLVTSVLPVIIASQIEEAERADAAIIDRLVRLLFLIEWNERLWTDRSFRAVLLRGLEALASLFSKRYSRTWKAVDPGTHLWIKTRTEGLAAGVREMETWLVTPRLDTREQLLRRLAAYLVCCMRGDWDSLPVGQVDAGTKHLRWADRTLGFVRGLISAALPGGLLVLVRTMFHTTIPDPARTYLYVGAILWAVITMLAAVDPQYSSKLEMVKGFLPFSGGLKAKD